MEEWGGAQLVTLGGKVTPSHSLSHPLTESPTEYVFIACYDGLNCVPPKSYVEVLIPVPQTVTVLETKLSKR